MVNRVVTPNLLVDRAAMVAREVSPPEASPPILSKVGISPHSR